MRTVPSGPGAANSFITTASDPGGRQAPVMILTASPRPTRAREAEPARATDKTLRRHGTTAQFEARTA